VLRNTATDVAQVIEHLPLKQEVLFSNSNTAKQNNNNKKVTIIYKNSWETKIKKNKHGEYFTSGVT
jgi:hypothetical protein